LQRWSKRGEVKEKKGVGGRWKTNCKAWQKSANGIHMHTEKNRERVGGRQSTLKKKNELMGKQN